MTSAAAFAGAANATPALVSLAGLAGGVWSMPAFHLAVQMLAVFVAVHLGTSAFIAWKDLTGQWKQYELNGGMPRRATLRTYLVATRSFFVDQVCILLPALTASIWYKWDDLQYANEHDAWWMSLLKLFVSFNAGRIWAYVIHRWVLHSTKFGLYRRIHKKHHCVVGDLVPCGAWLDTTVEYVLMELPTLCGMLLFAPTAPVYHFVFFAIDGFGAATDHSGFGFNDGNGAPWLLQFLMDSEYHFLHHKEVKVNYGEVEWLDLLLGTHHSQSASGIKAQLEATAGSQSAGRRPKRE